MSLRLITTITAIASVSICFSQQPGNFEFKGFIKPKENPVLKADSSLVFQDPISNNTVRWQRADVFNPAAIVKGEKIFLVYRCEDNPTAVLGGRTSRLGVAESSDGIHFTKYHVPVLYPDNDNFKQYDYPGGCEDPRIVETDDGKYILVYTSWNQKMARLSVAESDDLYHWRKYGPVFLKAQNGKFLNIWSKSGSIVTEWKNGKQVVAKVNGKYLMYWGEQFVNLAWSDNLIDWNPMVDENGNLLKIIQPRKKKFDSNLTECGPPAMLTKQGIVLLYNGKNANNENADETLPKGTYSVGKVVFDLSDPQKVISRSDTCLLKPSLPHEMTGQYQAGTTFAEGLVYFKNKWFLYYGTADSFVGVAIANP